jgi:hypothetical protein
VVTILKKSKKIGIKRNFHQKSKAVLPFDDFSPTEND